MKTSIAPVSSAWPSLKALQAKNHKTENRSPEEGHIRHQEIGNHLTKEDTLGQKGAFLDVDEVGL